MAVIFPVDGLYVTVPSLSSPRLPVSVPPDVKTNPLFSFVDSLSVIVTVVATEAVVAVAAVPVKPASEILPFVSLRLTFEASTTTK